MAAEQLPGGFGDPDEQEGKREASVRAVFQQVGEGDTRGLIGDAVELIDLRTIAPWDRETVLASVKKTGRCLIVHEDSLTAGFGAEIAGALVQDAFWHLDAPVERLAPRDIPVPYHPDLLEVVIPSVNLIRERASALLAM